LVRQTFPHGETGLFYEKDPMPAIPRAPRPEDIDVTDQDLPHRLHCVLEAGRLELAHDGDPGSGTALFGFAERINPRRAFLFVSRVLGRHIPVAPSRMRAAFTALAEGVPDDLPGPVLMTGMAETAVGLGAGVHDAYITRTGRDDVVYLATTRARLEAPLMAAFREEHSHASHHLLHEPQHAHDRDKVARARSLVMVDDEASTGNTFRNLAAALMAPPGGKAGSGLPDLIHVHTAVLTDWSHRQGLSVLPVAAGPDIVQTASSLLRGGFAWHARAGAPQRALPDADLPRRASLLPIRRADDARLGRSVRSVAAIPDGLLNSLGGTPGTILVLGSGEHVWEPFLLAEALERAGHTVLFSATTRSPILAGHAIASGYVFADHEGLCITNYLYNVDPAQVSRIILCVDTAADTPDPRLLRALAPDLVVCGVLHDRHMIAAKVAGAAPATRFFAPRSVPDAETNPLTGALS